MLAYSELLHSAWGYYSKTPFASNFWYPNIVTPEAFNLDSQASYLRWRDLKLSDYPDRVEPVPINDPAALDTNELNAIKSAVSRCNFVVYQLANPGQLEPGMLLRLGKQLGLEQNDHNICAEDIGITALEVKTDAAKRYIPYTNKPLSWHTDGYYNPPSQQIKAWLLHCVREAVEGGDNELMDHEIAYIRLRDHDPRLIEALQQPRAMTIPANTENGREIRGAQTGPVFSYDSRQQRLHMRYSARLKHVVWYDDDDTREATAFLKKLFTEGDEYLHRLKLEPGQGVLSNNILHRRKGFTDTANQPGRLLYRARYYNSISV